MVCLSAAGVIIACSAQHKGSWEFLITNCSQVIQKGQTALDDSVHVSGKNQTKRLKDVTGTSLSAKTCCQLMVSVLFKNHLTICLIIIYCTIAAILTCYHFIALKVYANISHLTLPTSDFLTKNI